MKFYLQNAMDGELTFITESLETLVHDINMDRIDLDNNYLVLESQLTDAQKKELLTNA